MSAPTITPAVKATATCPAWCVSDHHDDDRFGRHHKAARMTSPEGLRAHVSVFEPRTAAGRYAFGEGGRILFLPCDINVPGVYLRVDQAADLARVMTEMGQHDAAELLHRAVELAGGA